MRVVVTGSRSWANPYPIRARIYDLARAHSDLTVLHGGGSRPDWVAGDSALEFGRRVEVYMADWHEHGKRAGIIRNLEMLDKDPDLVLAFWDGESRGTKHCMDAARERGIPVKVISP